MIMGLGHSTFSQDDFVDVCKTAEVNTIIDVRSHPGSNANPQYHKENMRGWLGDAGIGYEWWPGLGGWDNRHANLIDEMAKYDVDLSFYVNSVFPKQRIAKSRKLGDAPGFTNYGFHDYQFFMMLPEFTDAMNELIERGKEENVACICCEACWTRCHRSMMADALVVRGIEFYHINPRFRKIKLPRTVVKLQKHSSVIRDRLDRYHKDVVEKFNLINK